MGLAIRRDACMVCLEWSVRLTAAVTWNAPYENILKTIVPAVPMGNRTPVAWASETVAA
jgi:hypothetical protein